MKKYLKLIALFLFSINLNAQEPAPLVRIKK